MQGFARVRDCLAYGLVGVQEPEEFGDWHAVGCADAADRDWDLVSFCQLIRLGPADADCSRGGEQTDGRRAAAKLADGGGFHPGFLLAGCPRAEGLGETLEWRAGESGRREVPSPLRLPP